MADLSVDEARKRAKTVLAGPENDDAMTVAIDVLALADRVEELQEQEKIFAPYDLRKVVAESARWKEERDQLQEDLAAYGQTINSLGKELDKADNQAEELAGQTIDLTESIAQIKRERDEARKLVVAHHAAGALDGVLVGDVCPVCEATKQEGKGNA